MVSEKSNFKSNYKTEKIRENIVLLFFHLRYNFMCFSSLSFVNSDCHAYATDYDVDRLRVKMLEAGKDEERMKTALKFFKTKCFSTHQIRALSEVFATDASKFKFLEIAYPFVSDDHFPELINLLSDPVYNGRFKIMTDRH